MHNIIPVSVLVDICKAIDEDEKASERAQEVAITLIPPVTRKLSDVIMRISDTDVRRWALNEIKGVEDDRNTAT
jgi:hypothetical protein